MGPVVQLLSRTVQRDLSAAVEIAGWKTKLKLSTQAIQNLDYLMRHFDSFVGHGIQTPATAIPLQAVLGPVLTANPVFIYQNDIAHVVAGDASDRAVCAYAVKGPSFFLQQTLQAFIQRSQRAIDCLGYAAAERRND